MKKLIPILLAIFVLMGTHVALGAEVTKASGSAVVSPAAYQTISGGQCQIVNNGNGTINISGSTSTYYGVEQIGLKLNLQYLSGGSFLRCSNYYLWVLNLNILRGRNSSYFGDK